MHLTFDKVGILLAAECRLLLDAPGCRGKFTSSEAMIVAAYSCGKLMFLFGRLIGVCSLSMSVRRGAGEMVRGFHFQQSSAGLWSARSCWRKLTVGVVSDVAGGEKI